MYGPDVYRAFLFNGQIYVYGGPFLGLSFGGDESLVVFDDFFADGQANAGAIIFFFCMQAVKDFEYLLVIGRCETNPVVGKGNMVITRIRQGGAIADAAAADGVYSYNDMRRGVFFGIFERVADDIDKQLLELEADYRQLRQRIGFYERVFFVDELFHLLFGALQENVQRRGGD